MTNQPLSGREQALVLSSIFLMSILWPLSIISLLLFLLGLFLMRKNEDFSYLVNTIAIVQWGFLLTLALSAMYGSYLYFTAKQLGYNFFESFPEDEHLTIVILAVASLAGYFIVKYMLLRPLRLHHEFVEKYGIFASKPSKNKARKAKQIAITQSESLRSYSVADELMKWANLKDGGHISQDEYDDARSKLLQRDQ
jgi:hypothetical protein